MFEKEAEERGNEKIKENHQFARCARKSYKEGFQDGAEFGYNKAKEDADKMKSRFLDLCNLKDMRIEELEKALERNCTSRTKGE